MLNDFRTERIVWDKADASIYKRVTANSGDTNGRKMEVQVLNGGVAEDLTGATLSLSWRTKDGVSHGLDAFDVTDATNGLFEIYYTTGMLTNEGTLRTSLVLVDSVGRIESSGFSITVEPSNVDDGAVQSENSFTTLTDALVRVEGLEDSYAPRLDELDAQLAHKAERTEMLSNDNDLSGRIDNLILGSGTDSSAEVQDARQSLDGTNYDLLSQRLSADFNRTARTKISTLEPFDSKDGDLWFKPKQSSLYEGVKLNGTSSYIDMTEHVDFINNKIAETNKMTLEIVLKSNDFLNISWIGGGQTLDDSGRYKFGLRGGENRIQAYTSVGQIWYENIQVMKKLYLTLMYDGSELVLYENGVKKSSLNVSSTIVPFTNFIFGKDAYQDGIRYFHGEIFDIRLWNIAMSESEVKNNLGVELSGAESGLVGYWDLNEKEGGIARDITLNGLDGTIFDGEWVTSID